MLSKCWKFLCFIYDFLWYLILFVCLFLFFKQDLMKHRVASNSLCCQRCPCISDITASTSHMLGLQASAIMTQLLVLFLTEVWKIYFSTFFLLILQIKVQHVILKSNRKKWKDNQDKNFNTLCRMSPAAQVRVNEDRPAQRAVEMSLGMQAVGRQASALHLVRRPA